MTTQTKSASPLAWVLVAASALTLVSCISGVAWLGWRIAQGPPPDTTVYDPSKPLHENPRARQGNYNTEEPLEYRWRSADGSSTLHMRIPGEWIVSAGGERRGLRFRENLSEDFSDGVSNVSLSVWLSDGPNGLVAIPLKLVRARMAPGQNEVAEPGMHSVLDLSPEYRPNGFRGWADGSGLRELLDYRARQPEKRNRRLAGRYGLERYRAQACGSSLPANVDEYPLLPEEPDDNDDCRDLGNPPEEWLSPREEPDGVAFRCLLFHGAVDRNPHCYTNYADYRGWRMAYSIPMPYMYRWQEVRAELRELLATWEVSESAPSSSASQSNGATP